MDEKNNTPSYRLTRKTIGANSEKSYEFNITVPKKEEKENVSSNRAGNVQRRKVKKIHNYDRSARAQAEKELLANNNYNQKSNTLSETNTSSSDYYKPTQRNNDINQQGYDFNLSIPRPKRERYNESLSRRIPRGRYVLDKNGRRVFVKTQAEYLAKKAERDEAIKQERKRMLEEMAVARAESSIRTVKSRSAHPIPWKIVMTIVLCSFFIMAIIFNSVKLNEHNRTISTLENQYSSLLNTKKELEDAIDKKNDLTYLEEYAVYNRGMVNVDKVTREYIYIINEEKIEVAGQTDSSSSSGSVEQTLINKITKIIQEWLYIIN